MYGFFFSRKDKLPASRHKRAAKADLFRSLKFQTINWTIKMKQRNIKCTEKVINQVVKKMVSCVTQPASLYLSAYRKKSRIIWIICLYFTLKRKEKLQRFFQTSNTRTLFLLLRLFWKCLHLPVAFILDITNHPCAIIRWISW